MIDRNRQGRRTLVLLAIVFLGPMAVAMGLYFTGFQFRPEGTTHHGLLYVPARPLPDLSMPVADQQGVNATLHGKWSLVYIGPGECGSPCREALVEMRQVRRALGRERERVQRLYLVTDGEADMGYLAREHAGIGVLAGGAGVASVVGVTGTPGQGEIFLADPLGNLVLRYPAGTGMKGIHDDLRHLLKVSTIG